MKVVNISKITKHFPDYLLRNEGLVKDCPDYNQETNSKKVRIDQRLIVRENKTVLDLANNAYGMMFEYMAAGHPVISSNIMLWQAIIESNKCGICVDLLNPKEIADAIQYIVSNPKEAEEKGYHGIKAVKEKYNWSIEENKLFKVYKDLLGE